MHSSRQLGSANKQSLTRSSPKGPCARIVYTLAPRYPYTDYFKAKVYTIWVHGPLEFSKAAAGHALAYKEFRVRARATTLWVRTLQSLAAWQVSFVDMHVNKKKSSVLKPGTLQFCTSGSLNQHMIPRYKFLDLCQSRNSTAKPIKSLHPARK